MTSNTTFELPSLRDVFFNSGLEAYTTPLLDEYEEKFQEALAVCKTFSDRDAIESVVIAQINEAKVIGFEQGVAFAMQTLAGANSIASRQQATVSM